MSPKPQMQPFSSLLLEHTKIYESPTSFWEWSAYATISAVLRDNCYRQQGDNQLFPNIYTLLLADSGGRKDKPIRLCEKLVKAAGTTKVINGRTSIQAVLDTLDETETDGKTGIIRKGGSGILIAPELAASMVEDPQAISILTDIYDLKEDYGERLRGRPNKINIDRIVFSMLAGSNADMLQNSVFNKTAVQGGLLARTFLIVPDEFRPANSLLRETDKKESLHNLVLSIRKIADMRGEFHFEEAAIKEYEEWYNPFRSQQLSKPDKSGVLGRYHTGILKMTMILAANDYSLIVTEKHVEKAIDLCMRLIPNYNLFVMVAGKSDIADAGAIIFEDLLKAPGYILSKKELLRRHWSQFSSETLEKFIITVEQGELIQQVVQGSNISYKLTKKCLDVMYGGVKKDDDAKTKNPKP